MTRSLNHRQFDGIFERFASAPTSTSVFRWEGLQHYAVDYDEPSWKAFREGTPRPDRSIRTDDWLARIARSTLAGKDWSRVRHVVEPVSDYVRWELTAYSESAPVGEQIGIIRRLPDSVVSLPDFWLFDGETDDDRHAIVMHYSAAGEPVDFDYRDDRADLGEFHTFADQLRRLAEPLNVYLARGRQGPWGLVVHRRLVLAVNSSRSSPAPGRRSRRCHPGRRLATAAASRATSLHTCGTVRGGNARTRTRTSSYRWVPSVAVKAGPRRLTPQ